MLGVSECPQCGGQGEGEMVGAGREPRSVPVLLRAAEVADTQELQLARSWAPPAPADGQ